MKIQINYGDIDSSPALSNHVQTSVDDALERFEESITRIEVHLKDDKQKRRGEDDNRCTIEIRIAGDKPFVVDATAGDVYVAVRDAVDKAQRAVSRRIERRDG